jgi:hypothetical protein
MIALDTMEEGKKCIAGSRAAPAVLTLRLISGKWIAPGHHRDP